MKILQVTPFFHPAYWYGGPIPVLYELCLELVGKGCAVKVLTTDTNGPSMSVGLPSGCEVNCGGFPIRYCHRVARNSVSPALVLALQEYVAWADVVHLSCVYSFPTIPALLASSFLAKPLVWSPMGALQRWTGSRRLFLKRQWDRVCRLFAPRDFVIHVTSEAEATESRKIFPSAQFAVVPHGIHLPERQKAARSKQLKLLFLGRLDPKKGLENLLDACKLLQRSWCGREISWRLTVAGTGDPAYVARLRSRIEGLGLTRQVTMTGHVMGECKADLLTSSDVLVVPSFTENFAMVVVESLAHGVPVLASTGTPWAGLDQKGCGLWIKNDPESLASGITAISAMDINAMGARGRQWMREEYSWSSVTERMIKVYRMRL